MSGALRTADDSIIALAERLLAVLDRGSFTSTYKYAVLLGLIDLAVEKTDRSGAAPSSVTTHELAEKVTALYWRHAHTSDKRPELLAQNRPQAGKRPVPEIIRRIHSFRASAAPDPTSPLTRAKLAAPGEWRRLVREVEWKLVEMPLPRLQRVGDRADPFLFAIRWDDRIRRGEFNDPARFDNVIRFIGNAGEALVRLAGLLRPLVQREWARLVADFNELPEATLERELFGEARSSLDAVRSPLLELQRGLCFYCQKPANDGAQVDHFVPWARHPNDAIENLVVAHAGCNGAKSDHLAAERHIEHWLLRMESTSLIEIASQVGWEHDAERCLGTTRGIYVRLPPETPLWLSATTFVGNDRDSIRRILLHSGG